MDCPACGAPTESFPVPEELAAHAPGAASTVAVCTDCLHVAPADVSADTPDPGRVSDALPADPAAALGVVLAVDLLASLATNRPAIEALLETAERRGVDPVLALQRLADDPAVSAVADLERRLDQLEGFRR